MKTINKFNVPPSGGNVELNIDAEILSAGFQESSLYFWALVDTDNVKMPRKFKVFATGENIPLEVEDSLKFISIARLGFMVFHLFEILDA